MKSANRMIKQWEVKYSALGSLRKKKNMKQDSTKTDILSGQKHKQEQEQISDNCYKLDFLYEHVYILIVWVKFFVCFGSISVSAQVKPTKIKSPSTVKIKLHGVVSVFTHAALDRHKRVKTRSGEFTISKVSKQR